MLCLASTVPPSHTCNLQPHNAPARAPLQRGHQDHGHGGVLGYSKITLPAMKPPCNPITHLRARRCSVATRIMAMAASLGVRSACPIRPVTHRLMRRSVRRRRSSSSGGCLAEQATRYVP